MRIGIALVVLADLFIRAGDLNAHYTDNGLWPREVIYNFGWNAGYWSVHALSGKYYWIITLFVVHIFATVALLVGYKTKTNTVIVWLLMISLHNRNLYIQQSGDDLLRLMLFWGIFLPWQAHYSVDTFKNKSLPKPAIFPNIGYLLLISSVYFFAAALKTSPEWHSDGSAVYYALSLEQLRLPAGDLLYNYPTLLKSITHFVYYLELLVPILILWPAKNGYLRFCAFILLIFLHTGIGLTLYVGIFFVTGMVSAIGLLPAFFMNGLETKFHMKNFKITFLKTKKTILNPVFMVIGTIVIFLSLLINLSRLNWFDYELKNELNYSVNLLRLNQNWGMFSPGILKKDGWFVYHGMDSIGRQWDLRLNQDYVDYKKPKHVVSMYKTDRWRKLAENMQNDTYAFLRPLYGKYILHEWNLQHPEKKIMTLNLYYMQKENLRDYKTTPLTKKLFCVSNDN